METIRILPFPSDLAWEEQISDMQANILIIEDEIEIAELMQLYLEKDGMSVLLAQSAEQATDILNENPIDLIILDINLPGKDGFEFLQMFRKESNLPVIIASAREADEDIILALGIGADEFVTKPFSPKVITAKVRAFLRRTLLFSEQGKSIYRFGSFALDSQGYNLKKNSNLVPLTVREFEILRLLIENSGRALSTQEVYDQVWGQEFGDIMAVSVYIQRIRKKIEDDYKIPRYILTIRGKGYLFPKELIQ